MDAVEAARRLGVHETQIRSVVEHPAGHLATLRSGAVMLVSETVARAYVPEVDDPESAFVGEDGPELTKLPTGAEVVAKPRTVPKRKTSGGSGS